ncbi:RNA-binding protein [Candidatus Pacearchaeota archaeon]|nr:RNA-binding protein [Candidatus Pacearchaeota archaeon]
MTENTEGRTSEPSNKATSNRSNDNSVFIGSKPLVNYIRGVITQFMRKDAAEVVIRSRGKFISKAVDVAEIAKRSLENAVKVKEIKIGSESFESEGKKTNISTMDIVLVKE